MKKIISVLIIAVIMLTLAPAAYAEETPSKNLYDMDFTLDTDAKSFEGTFKLTAYNDSEDPWDELFLPPAGGRNGRRPGRCDRVQAHNGRRQRRSACV